MSEEPRKPINDECLGKLRENYCEYCSSECRWANVCALIVVSNYLLQEQILLPPDQPISIL